MFLLRDGVESPPQVAPQQVLRLTIEGQPHEMEAMLDISKFLGAVATGINLKEVKEKLDSYEDWRIWLENNSPFNRMGAQALIDLCESVTSKTEAEGKK